MQAESSYNDKVVRQFTIMTVVWGVVGMLVGLDYRRATDLARPEHGPAVSDV